MKGQEVPSCDFCGKTDHTESACHSKAKAMESAKKETKERNAQWKKEKAEKAISLAAASSAPPRRKKVLRMKMNSIRNEDEFDKK
jgi:hypothetical protein